MKRLVPLLLLLLLPAGFASAGGGVGTSGGGRAVVCRDSLTGMIRGAELLDLYEARVRDGRSLILGSGSLTRDYLRAVRNTYRLQGYALLDALDGAAAGKANLHRFLARIHFTGPGERLQPLEDLGAALGPPVGCALEQVAIFQDASGAIDMDREIWNRMDSLNRAALVEHELFYREERSLGETTSESTRRMIGLIFAADGVVPARAGLPPGALDCWATSKSGDSQGTTEFYAYPAQDSQGAPATILQFTALLGHPILSRTVVEVPSLEGRAFLGRVPVEGPQGAEREVRVDYTPGGRFEVELFENGNPAGQVTVDRCSGGAGQ